MSKIRSRGVLLTRNKNTLSNKARLLPVPAAVNIPMSMNIGAPAVPIVSAGEYVKVGQLIGEAGGVVSAPVHSGVSGTVKSINPRDSITGRAAVSITIIPDGAQTIYEGLQPHPVTNIGEFLAAVRSSGVVGLGGAGFPTAVKLDVKEPDSLECIIINGAECEPYIASDTRTMVDDSSLVLDGVLLLKKFYRAGIIIAVERDNLEALEKMRRTVDGLAGVEVRALPAIYPQGGEKALVYQVTGHAVPEGGLPVDAGAIVLNCTTLAAIARFINTGMPVVSKCVTVDGTAVKSPDNIIAPIGTPVRELFDFCGGLSEDVKKVLLGGPMMGVAIPSLDFPVMKTTNAVLAMRAKDAEAPRESACIRCGRCVANCPMHLMPLELERAYLLKKPDLLEHYKVRICMECGCCAYVCPAKRPLVQVMQLAKEMCGRG